MEKDEIFVSILEMKLFLWDFFCLFLRLVTDIKRKFYGFAFKIARARLNKYSDQPVHQLSYIN